MLGYFIFFPQLACVVNRGFVVVDGRMVVAGMLIAMVVNGVNGCQDGE